MNHVTQVEMAIKHGQENSLFMGNIIFWMQKNLANDRHLYEGRYWTYNSTKALCELFPYWSEKQIRRIIKNCISEGLLLTGNFNKSAYDRTQWFSPTDRALMFYPTIWENHQIKLGLICPNGQMDFPERSNGFYQKGTPIPDTFIQLPSTDKKIKTLSDSSNAPKTGKISDYTKDELFMQFYAAYPKKQKPKDAHKMFKRLNLDAVDVAILIKDVKQRVLIDDHWQEKQYIPYPATYLNARQWESEITNSLDDKKKANEENKRKGEESARRAEEESRRRAEKQFQYPKDALIMGKISSAVGKKPYIPLAERLKQQK